MHTILLVDDHLSVMEGTRLILELDKQFQVSMENCARTAATHVTTTQYDLYIVDMNMPEMSGLELAKHILQVQPDAIILIYTGYELANNLNEMINTGIAGLIPKTASREQLIRTIEGALRREVVLPLDLFRKIGSASASILTQSKSTLTESNQDTATPEVLLTQKEQDILIEIARSKSNKEIANGMFISKRTLEYHITNIFSKLGVKSRIEAVNKAKYLRLISSADFI